MNQLLRCKACIKCYLVCPFGGPFVFDIRSTDNAVNARIPELRVDVDLVKR